MAQPCQASRGKLSLISKLGSGVSTGGGGWSKRGRLLFNCIYSKLNPLTCCRKPLIAPGLGGGRPDPGQRFEPGSQSCWYWGKHQDLGSQSKTQLLFFLLCLPCCYPMRYRNNKRGCSWHQHSPFNPQPSCPASCMGRDLKERPRNEVIIAVFPEPPRGHLHHRKSDDVVLMTRQQTPGHRFPFRTPSKLSALMGTLNSSAVTACV